MVTFLLQLVSGLLSRFSTLQTADPFVSFFLKLTPFILSQSGSFSFPGDIEAILLAYIKEQEKRIEQITTENKLYGKE